MVANSRAGFHHQLFGCDGLPQKAEQPGTLTSVCQGCRRALPQQKSHEVQEKCRGVNGVTRGALGRASPLWLSGPLGYQLLLVTSWPDVSFSMAPTEPSVHPCLSSFQPSNLN